MTPGIVTDSSWTRRFRYDPIKPLLHSENPAIVYFARRDILEEPVEEVSRVWQLPEVQRITGKQRPEGYWKSSSAGRTKNPAQNYDLLETFRQTNTLINLYGLNRDHPCIERAAEYLFSCQTEEGDIRGIIGEQYAPYYTGLIAANLNRAGYVDDPRVEHIIRWLLSMRQNDGGWIVGSPGCLGTYTREEEYALTTQFVGTRRDFDCDRPSGYVGTGMVLPAFATHPVHRATAEAREAATLLAELLFEKNTNMSYEHPDNWVRFKYPFWWPDLISAMDSLVHMGLTEDHAKIAKALEWFTTNQLPAGMWKHSYSKIHKYSENATTRKLQLWIGLAILRIFKSFAGD